MPKDAKFKSLIRTRMERTGETYTQAREALIHERDTTPDATAHAAEVPAPEAAPPTTLDRIRAVMDAYPDLSYHGFRTKGFSHRDVKEKGLDAVKAEEQAAFDARRANLLTEDCVQQVEACLTLLQHVRKARGPTVSSYSLKHVVERWRRGENEHGPDFYVANGALIVSARIGGFRIRHESGNINCAVYANREDLVAIDHGEFPPKRVKPTPFVKWLFGQAKRDDPVGDFAGDAMRDRGFPRDGDFQAIRGYILRYPDHARNALSSAYAEYRMEPLRKLQRMADLRGSPTRSDQA